MDQAINSAKAYQQSNQGFNYSIQRGTNGGFSVVSAASSAPVNTDLTNQVQQSATSSTSTQQPTNPAC
jgi:hypothetical protein